MIGKQQKVLTKPNPNINDASALRQAASREKIEERETWHKLVVKVIIWKERSFAKVHELTSEGKPSHAPNINGSSLTKLTNFEWKTYFQKIIQISVTQDKKKVMSDLKETLEKIKLNGGLE